jgi:hypothetical protein
MLPWLISLTPCALTSFAYCKNLSISLPDKTADFADGKPSFLLMLTLTIVDYSPGASVLSVA